jgi:hypothetical protein
MLSKPDRLLISAYVEGDVSPQQRKAAERVLQNSAEARKLLQELRSDSHNLRSLSRQVAPAELAVRVGNSFATLQPIIRPPVTLYRQRGPVFTLARFMTAAAILLAVMITTFLVIQTPNARPLSAVSDVSHSRDLERTSSQGYVPKNLVAKHRPDSNFVEPLTTPAHPIARAEPKTSVPLPEADSRPNMSDVLGNSPAPLPSFVEITAPPLALSLPVRGMDSNDVREAMQKELTRSDARRIDLFCRDRDTLHGVERLQAACRLRGVRLTVEPVAQESLRRRLPGRSYALYTDSLTAVDWIRLMQAAGTLDKQAEQLRPGDGVFDQAVLLPISSSDQRDLTALIGLDLTQQVPSQQMDRGRDARPLDVAAPKSKSGLLLPYSFRPAQGSVEVRQFLEARQGRVAGTIAVLLVVR